MQKKIIALAVAALASSAAFAQTNVTIYGVADIGQAYVWASGDNSAEAGVTRLDSNSSYLGFKGVEDLGNGLKAVFQFETGYNPDTGSGFDKSRDSFVGLTGGFGTVVGGTLTHPLRAMGAKVELMPGATGLGLAMSQTGNILGKATGADTRANNAIAYVSPSFGGFSGTVAYINGETRDSTVANGVANLRAYQVAGQYENGPLFAAVGYHRVIDAGVGVSVNSTTGVVTASFPTVSAHEASSVLRAAAAYTFPSKTKITALVDKTRASVTPESDASGVSRLAYSLGVSQGFGKNTVGLQYAHSNKAKEVGGDSIDNTSSSVISAIYTYDLSKRTMVHARVSRLSNKDGINNNFYVNPVAQGLTNGVGSDYTGVMLGLRHSF